MPSTKDENEAAGHAAAADKPWWERPQHQAADPVEPPVIEPAARKPTPAPTPTAVEGAHVQDHEIERHSTTHKPIRR